MTPFSDNALFAITLALLALGLFALLARLRPDLPWPLRLMLTTIGTQGLFLLSRRFWWRCRILSALTGRRHSGSSPLALA